jgi:hypothetical protein
LRRSGNRIRRWMRLALSCDGACGFGRRKPARGAGKNAEGMPTGMWASPPGKAAPRWAENLWELWRLNCRIICRPAWSMSSLIVRDCSFTNGWTASSRRAWTPSRVLSSTSASTKSPRRCRSRRICRNPSTRGPSRWRARRCASSRRWTWWRRRAGWSRRWITNTGVRARDRTGWNCGRRTALSWRSRASRCARTGTTAARESSITG